jgi:hypothetical protein
MFIPNLAILLDEIKEAEKATEGMVQPEYATGYEDGLRMALDILEGRVE